MQKKTILNGKQEQFENKIKKIGKKTTICTQRNTKRLKN